MNAAPLILSARQLAGLVNPVLPHAASSRDLPVLSTVLIESDGKWLIASATDRFTVGIQRIEKVATDEDPETEWPPFRALIPLRSIKSLLSMCKVGRGSVLADISLTVEDDRLIAEASGGFEMFASSRFTFYLEPGEYPDMKKALRVANAATSEGGNLYAFNPKVLARFQNLGYAMTVKFGPKGAIVTDDEGFIGAIMPRRRLSGEAESWDDFLGAKDEVAA